MKKIKYLLLTLLLLIPVGSKAAVYHCSAPGSAVSGSTFTVKFYGSLSSSNATWTGLIVSEGNASYQSGGLQIWSDGSSFSRTVTYKAGNPGTARFYVGNIDVSDENQEYTGSDVCTVNIVEANSSNTSSRAQANVSSSRNKDTKKSSNNNLNKLFIDGVELSPEFNKDTLEYSAVVEGDKDKINIEVGVEDGKASVEGDGEKELQEGLNEIKIIVHAENGDIKEYKVNITRKELNPIEVTIDGKKYTVVKKETDMEIPEGFEKKDIKINGEDVVSYENKFTSNVLVVLIDEEGNKGFYSYNKKNNTYIKYIELKSKELKLMIIDPKEEIPFRYKKISFTINGQKIDGYCYKASSKFRLVYGVNIENGDEGFYQYDMNQKTFQRFYNDQVEKYNVYAKYVMYGICGAAGLLLILFISIIALISKNRKLKKKLKGDVVKENKKEKKEEPRTLTREERLRLREEKNKEKEEAPASEEVDNKELKKEQKRLAKEAKIKAKEEKKLSKQKLNEEDSSKKESELSSRELRRKQKEEDKKLKEEANEFLK